MSGLAQHLVVILLVAGCLGFVVWQTVRTLRGKRSRIGSCCAKGCAETAKPQAAKTERIVFMPVEMLSRRK